MHRICQVMKMERTLESIPALFPEPLKTRLFALLANGASDVEELRLRNGYPPSYLIGGREIALETSDKLPAVDGVLLEEVLRRASQYSSYAVQSQLCQGFLTLPGGHRLGVCGRVVRDNSGIKNITELQSLNLRIARQRIGAADPATNLLWSQPGSALIIGSPGSGKTTILRDLIRQVSDRFSQRVGVVDERGEIAACLDGIPQLRIGRRTDVISGCGKKEGIEMLLRTMNPKWIAIDEITSDSDADTLIQSSYTGVRFLATAHVWDRSDLTCRPVYRRLLDSGMFEILIEIKSDRALCCERIKYACHKTDWDDSDYRFFRMGRDPCGEDSETVRESNAANAKRT